MEITGAELFVKALKAESVTTLFAYPGVVVVDLPKDIQRAYGGDRYQTQVTGGEYQPDCSVYMGQLVHRYANNYINHLPAFLSD